MQHQECVYKGTNTHHNTYAFIIYHFCILYVTICIICKINNHTAYIEIWQRKSWTVARLPHQFSAPVCFDGPSTSSYSNKEDETQSRKRRNLKQIAQIISNQKDYTVIIISKWIQMALRCIRQVRALILEASLMCSCARRSMPLCAAWIFLAASSWKFCKSWSRRKRKMLQTSSGAVISFKCGLFSACVRLKNNDN